MSFNEQRAIAAKPIEREITGHEGYTTQHLSLKTTPTHHHTYQAAKTVGVPAISKHLKNIFEEGELQKEMVVSKMEITTQHGAMEIELSIS